MRTVKALPTPVTRYIREVAGIPLFTWTVRTAEDRKIARESADAAIFEGGGAWTELGGYRGGRCAIPHRRRG